MENIYKLINKNFFNNFNFFKSNVSIYKLITINLFRDYKIYKIINFYKVRVI